MPAKPRHYSDSDYSTRARRKEEERREEEVGRRREEEARRRREAERPKAGKDRPDANAAEGFFKDIICNLIFLLTEHGMFMLLFSL